ncbi:MAG TPA: ABC transporter permease [Acidimicrobiales bacterium]|nr:ABC transporter permease [Acidimicrobiales bacterium]
MSLALREIRRAKLRFGLLSGAIGLLVFLILFQQTLLGTLLGYFTGALENQSGEVIVYGEDARRNIEGSVVTDEQVAAVAAVDGVADSAPLGEGTFTVRADGELTDAVLWGYRLGGPGEPTRLAEGRLPESDFEAVSTTIDAANGFGIGDEVLLADGQVTITVVGLASESRFSVLPVLFTSFDTYLAAASAVNPDAPFIPPTVVLANPVEGVSAAELAERITAEVAGVEALDRATAVDELPGVSAVSQSFNLILLLAYVVVTLVIGFFFLIITVQKAQALSLLKAIGASDRTLVGSLLFQVAVVTLGGIVVGGGLLQLAAFGSSEEFPIEADPVLVGGTGAVLLVLAGLAAIGSVRRVVRLRPTDAVNPQALGGLS